MFQSVKQYEVFGGVYLQDLIRYITRTSSKTSNVLPVQSYIDLYIYYIIYDRVYIYIICLYYFLLYICLYYVKNASGQNEEQRRKLSCVVFEWSVLRGSIILSCNPRTHWAHCLWQVMAADRVVKPKVLSFSIYLYKVLSCCFWFQSSSINLVHG